MNTKPVKEFKKFQEGLGFAIVMLITFMIMDLTKVEKITTRIFFRSFMTSAIAGAVAGFLYAWTMGLYFKYRNRNLKK